MRFTVLARLMVVHAHINAGHYVEKSTVLLKVPKIHEFSVRAMEKPMVL